MEEGEADFIINDFLGNLNSVESEEVPEKRKRICHVHWWDGWENKPKSEPEEDFEALNLQLSAILECIGDVDCKKGIMEELRKRAMTDKTGKSVNDLVLTIFEMASLAFGFSLNERINFASRVYKMLHAKFQIEGNERADVMSIEKEDEGEKAFGMSENKDSDDLLLRIEKVEAEWNALTRVEECQEAQAISNPENDEAHFEDRRGRSMRFDKKMVCQKFDMSLDMEDGEFENESFAEESVGLNHTDQVISHQFHANHGLGLEQSPQLQTVNTTNAAYQNSDIGLDSLATRGDMYRFNTPRNASMEDQITGPRSFAQPACDYEQRNGLLRHSITKHGGLGGLPSIYHAARLMSSRFFVGGLSFGVDDHTLKDSFAVFCEVKDARIINDQETRRPRGFGFVSYSIEGETRYLALILPASILGKKKAMDNTQFYT